MPEPIRLVVWDLDNTFWDGTLSEGGIAYREDRAAIVTELAGRGIISSICSKNDFATVRAVLLEHGIWDLFVFPSIDWSPKGPRLARLIEAAQLRPASILFIDDNPANLHEARHFLPDLQTRDADFVAAMLDDPLLAGKPDPGLVRLEDYKLLEQRGAARLTAGGDNGAFLRASNIRVRFEFDIETHMDRAVELIARTNQLNFTKTRLPADAAAARKELRTLASYFWVQMALVHVVDDYGDYGLVGLYAVIRTPSEFRLAHFCFSCRILGMGVESWLYRRLGRPAIGVQGEVMTDLFADDAVDWIGVGDLGARGVPAESAELGSAYLRGGCDLHVLDHYLRLAARSVTSELTVVHHGIELRIDHTVVLGHALRLPDTDGLAALEGAGYPREVFRTDLARDAETPALYVFSFWADAELLLYRDRLTDLIVPVHFHEFFGQDLTAIPAALFAERIDNVEAQAVHRFLRDRCECRGGIGEAEFKANLGAILDHVPGDARVRIVLLNDTPPGSAMPLLANITRINRWTSEATADDARVRLIPIRDCVADPAEMHGPNHFDRKVYHRLAREILATG
ncbi:MAG: HAD-IIIC family phosphatase [Acetobacteraceae bacterium]